MCFCYLRQPSSLTVAEPIYAKNHFHKVDITAESELSCLVKNQQREYRIRNPERGNSSDWESWYCELVD